MSIHVDVPYFSNNEQKRNHIKLADIPRDIFRMAIEITRSTHIVQRTHNQTGIKWMYKVTVQ